MAGLYLHIPFCRQRCSYCDFYFVTGSRMIGPFVEALALEIEQTHPRFLSETVETVYFGGGTPSRLTSDQLRTIIERLRARFDIRDSAEWTIEINPEDGLPSYLADLRRLGFNRLSIGIQSLKEGDLLFMRRVHTAEQSTDVVSAARDAGFDSFSVDLIFGLPGQTGDDWQRHLEFAIDRGVPHLSTYGLTVEPKTILSKWIRDGLVPVPDEDVEEALYRQTIRYLTAAGYEHYEISSFALPGARSRHNSAYWDHTNYLGFGPSSHSFWWTNEEAVRWANVRSLRRYLGAPGDTGDRETLDSATLVLERIMLGLRTSDGVRESELGRRYGFQFSRYGLDTILRLQSAGLLSAAGDQITLTESGRVVCNAVTAELCVDEVLERI